MNPASPRALISAGAEIYIPLEGKNNGPPTASDQMIHTPDNAAGAVLAQRRSLGRPGGKPNILFGVGRSKGAVNAHNFAFLEIDTASATPLTFRFGSVPDVSIGTFVAEDVPVAFTFDSVTRLPADGGDSAWLGDHFVATGKGMGVSGMNFIWYDATVKALRANQTGPDTLLKDHSDIRRSSITFGGLPTAIFTQFDLVFTEGTTLGDGSMTETLNYAEVDCLH